MRTLAAQLLQQIPARSNLRIDGDLLNGFLTHGTWRLGGVTHLHPDLIPSCARK
jgi:hypothetical protein